MYWGLRVLRRIEVTKIVAYNTAAHTGPDSQDRDCVKIAGMAMVYAQPVRPAADVSTEQ